MPWRWPLGRAALPGPGWLQSGRRRGPDPAVRYETCGSLDWTRSLCPQQQPLKQQLICIKYNYLLWQTQEEKGGFLLNLFHIFRYPYKHFVHEPPFVIQISVFYSMKAIHTSCVHLQKNTIFSSNIRSDDYVCMSLSMLLSRLTLCCPSSIGATVLFRLGSRELGFSTVVGRFSWFIWLGCCSSSPPTGELERH